MGRCLTTEEFIEKAKKLHGDKYDYSQTVYVRNRDKVIIICPKHGPFNQRGADHLSGHGCPGCQREWSDEHRANHKASARRSRGLTTEEWIARARAVHGDRYDYSHVVYENQRTKVTIVCPKHGVFVQDADSHIRGHKCWLCGIESRGGVHDWSDAQRIKIETTCLERYGAKRYLDSEAGRLKNAEIRSKPEFRAKMRRIISSDEVQEKTKATCMERYGVESTMMLPETIEKVHRSKLRNGSYRRSKPEDRMYELLCDRFGIGNVIRQYKDIRYPFYCDFYIKSLDLFIELNATWYHGGGWFDPNLKWCQDQLSKVKQKIAEGKIRYSGVIETWTVRDLRKKDAAVTNDLNYVVFWKNDLSDFMEWLNSETLVLNNI